MAQLGAEVIKVELPGFGDQARWVIKPGNTRSPFFDACNRGKRSVTIDLRAPQGAAAFRTLCATADVVISNFKPGTMDDWQLGYESLAATNPGLVYAAGSTFGPVGPDAAREGTDLAAQAAAGLIATTGTDGSEQGPVGVTLADHIASQNMVVGILGALLRRATTGRGQQVEVSLLGGQVWAQASEYTGYFLSGDRRARANRGHPLIPGIYGLFPTSDGGIAITGVVGDRRADFFRVVGRADLVEHTRFNELVLDDHTKSDLFDELSSAFRTRTTAQWCEVLQAAGLRYAPVRDHATASEDPQLWENGYLAKGLGADGVEQTIVGCPIRFGADEVHLGGPPPELGQHTE